jgi:hypothetical protein
MEQLPLEGGDVKLSARALSKASATDPIEGKSPASFSLLPNSTEVYWLPLSEWCTSPGAGRRLWIAMLSASSTSSVLRWLAIDQPTTRREKASKTKARYSHPSQLLAYVMSATQRRSGVSGTKLRLTRSGAAGTCPVLPLLLLRVACARLRPPQPTRPAFRISLATRFLAHLTPKARSSA